jgi:hypothetical protein
VGRLQPGVPLARIMSITHKVRNIYSFLLCCGLVVLSFLYGKERHPQAGSEHAHRIYQHHSSEKSQRHDYGSEVSQARLP